MVDADAVAEHLAAPGVAVVVRRAGAGNLGPLIGAVSSSTTVAMSTSRCSPEPMSRSWTARRLVEDHRVGDVEPVGLPHLALHAPPAEVELGPQSRVTKLGGEGERALPLPSSARDEHVGPGSAPTRRSIASRIRSTPAAHPQAGVGGPPTSSTSSS